MSLELGSAYPAALDVFDADGTPMNASTVTLTITLPDGTSATPAVPAPNLPGQYRYTYIPPMSGRYLVRWVTNAPNTGYTDAFDVGEAAPPEILPLADVKRAVDMDPAIHDWDDQIRDMLTGVTIALETYKNITIVPRPFTDWLDIPAVIYWRGPRVRLQHLPVIKIQSVAASDAFEPQISWDPANFHLNPDTGMITVINGPPITGRVNITYTAGLPVIPRNYTEAAKTLFQHLWESRRGPGGVTGIIGPEELGDWRHMTGMPRKVTEMMGPPYPAVL